MKWETVELGDCCEIVSGSTPDTNRKEFWGGNINWATPKDLSGLEGTYIDETPRQITEAGLKSCSAAMLPPYSVLFSSRAPIGHVAINTVPMCTNQGFKSFVPDINRLYPNYLYRWLRANVEMLKDLGNGATFKEVSKATVSRVRIPLPPVEEQKRIAEVLDKADALRQKRRLGLQKLDTLLQSVYLEMFGDPLRNSKGWRVAELREIGKVTTGSTPSSNLPNMFGGDIPFVTPGDLERTTGIVNRTLTKAGGERSRIVRSGSTLVCCIGATIGKVGKATNPSAFNQQINAIEWSSAMNDDFGFYLLKFYKSTIATLGASTTLPILKKSSFEKMKFPRPPIEMQNEFSEIAIKLESVKRSHERAGGIYQSLFQSLQHRAFSGELLSNHIVGNA